MVEKELQKRIERLENIWIDLATIKNRQLYVYVKDIYFALKKEGLIFDKTIEPKPVARQKIVEKRKKKLWNVVQLDKKRAVKISVENYKRYCCDDCNKEIPKYFESNNKIIIAGSALDLCQNCREKLLKELQKRK